MECRYRYSVTLSNFSEAALAFGREVMLAISNESQLTQPTLEQVSRGLTADFNVVGHNPRKRQLGKYS